MHQSFVSSALGDSAGLKCQALTSDGVPAVPGMRRGFNFPPIHGHIISNNRQYLINIWGNYQGGTNDDWVQSFEILGFYQGS